MPTTTIVYNLITPYTQHEPRRLNQPTTRSQLLHVTEKKVLGVRNISLKPYGTL